MKSLYQCRVAFTANLAKLVTWLIQNGYECYLGEVLRTPEQERLYISQGLSQTQHSRHLLGLACDLYVFKNGKQVIGEAAHAPIKAFWIQLDPSNQNGYKHFVDPDHYELMPPSAGWYPAIPAHVSSK